MRRRSFLFWLLCCGWSDDTLQCGEEEMVGIGEQAVDFEGKDGRPCVVIKCLQFVEMPVSHSEH